MKPFLNIPRTKEKQPDYWELWKSIMIRTFLSSRFLWSNIPDRKKIKSYNRHLFLIQLSKVKDDIKKMNIKYDNPERILPYKHKLDYISNNVDICIEWINIMIRNHIRKNNLYEMEFEEEDTEYLRSLMYEDYLMTEHRIKLVWSAKKRDWYKCVLCSSDERLEIHHRSYEHKWDMAEEINDIYTLCHDCHAKFHNKAK